MNASQVIRAAVLALAALRVTRFFTTDTLGEWLIVGRAKRWAWRREVRPVEMPALIEGAEGATGEPYTVSAALVLADIERQYVNGEPLSVNPQNGWRSKLTKGLDCPFCVGFWVGCLVLLGEVTLGRLPVVRHVWRFGVAAFALNYVTGHIGSRIDS